MDLRTKTQDLDKLPKATNMLRLYNTKRGRKYTKKRLTYF